MKEIIDSIRLQVHERLSSPLFGSLLLAWIGWNHRFLTVLFSNLSVEKRFELIDQQLYPTDADKWGRGLIWPVVTAIGFIVVYPYFANLAYGYWHWWQRKQKQLRDKIESATLLTVEESNAIRKQLYTYQAESDETIQRLRDEIRELRGSVKERPSTKAPNETKSDKPTKEGSAMPDGTMTIIGLLAKRDGSLMLNEIFTKIEEPRVRVQYYIDEAERLKLVELHRDSTGHYKAFLTPKGTEFAVKAKYV